MHANHSSAVIDSVNQKSNTTGCSEASANEQTDEGNVSKMSRSGGAAQDTKQTDSQRSTFPEKHTGDPPAYPESTSSIIVPAEMDRCEAIDRQKIKTVLCGNYMHGKQCRYGSHCAFAHGENELRAAPPAMMAKKLEKTIASQPPIALSHSGDSQKPGGPPPPPQYFEEQHIISFLSLPHFSRSEPMRNRSRARPPPTYPHETETVESNHRMLRERKSHRSGMHPQPSQGMYHPPFSAPPPFYSYADLHLPTGCRGRGAGISHEAKGRSTRHYSNEEQVNGLQRPAVPTRNRSEEENEKKQ